MCPVFIVTCVTFCPPQEHFTAHRWKHLERLCSSVDSLLHLHRPLTWSARCRRWDRRSRCTHWRLECPAWSRPHTAGPPAIRTRPPPARSRTKRTVTASARREIRGRAGAGTGHFCPRQHTDSRLTVIAYLPVRARAVNEQRDSPHSEQLQSNRPLPPGKGAPSTTATSALPFLFHNPLRHPASQSAGQTGDRQQISEQGAGPVSFRKETHGLRDN